MDISHKSRKLLNFEESFGLESESKLHPTD